MRLEAFERILPVEVLYVSESGCLVMKEEQLDNGRIIKVYSKLPMNPYDNRNWTMEEIEKECSDFIYYISNVDGGYIGAEEDYKYLTNKGLILIQKAKKKHRTCSIGYQPDENKWYGWSHRAIYGFGIGDEVHEGDLTTTTGFIEEYAIQHPEECCNLPVGFQARTLDDAKRMAIAFACAVS